jgi:acetyl esterase/lipase
MSALPTIPASVLREMADIGPRWRANIQAHVKAMIDAFTPVLALAAKEGVEVTRDIAYGSHARQILDVYKPRDAQAAPVLMFAHGGAFVDGERDRSPEIYSNVLRYFARHGIVGINMEYRLAPEFTYPSGPQDVALAVRWALANAGRFGGTPDSIYLMGHSAGAAHTGAYVYDQRFHATGGPRVAGNIVVSGRVRAETWPGNPNAAKVEAYYGNDSAAMDRGSVVNHVADASVPTMIAIGEFENPFIDVHCAELFYRIAKVRGQAPRFLRLAGHNHTSMIAHLNTADERLGLEIVSFIRGGAW